MTTATLFRNGRSQAVRLPKEFATRGEKVYVRRIGDLVVLIPKDADIWGSFAHGLEHFTDDFMSEPRTQGAQQQRQPVG